MAHGELPVKEIIRTYLTHENIRTESLGWDAPALIPEPLHTLALAARESRSSGKPRWGWWPGYHNCRGRTFGWFEFPGWPGQIRVIAHSYHLQYAVQTDLLTDSLIYMASYPCLYTSLGA